MRNTTSVQVWCVQCSFSVFDKPQKEKVGLTLEIEENHRQAPLSHSIMEVVRGQLCDGVHVRDETMTLVYDPGNFIIQLVWWQTHTHMIFFPFHFFDIQFS